jgi:UDP-N-acetylmuramate dehydrogenase
LKADMEASNLKNRNFENTLKERFSDSFHVNHSLAEYTTFKVGGPAKYFVECQTSRDTIDAVKLSCENEMKYFILGGGSNLLISDDGYSGLIIHIATSEMRVEDDHVLVDSGYNWEALVEYCNRTGLGGTEPLAGIKGTVGGAVYGNAGAFGKSIADILIEAEIFAPGEQPRWEKNKYFAFSYRNSILKKSKEVVLRVKLAYTRRSPETLLSKQAEIMELRCQKHPVTDCSAGCFFKNIEKPDEPHGKLPAGLLLEKVGAKETRIGGAEVSAQHANILINSGTATAADIKKLAELLKERVKNEFGYILEEEITFLGD